MKLKRAPLALPLALLFLPAFATAQPAPTPRSLSLENRTALRCAAAFAIVADGQARGKKDALAYPALDQRGREFFVRSSARVMDDTGMDRAAVAAALQAEAKDLWDKDAIGQIMPSCLLLLEASGV